jgi:hypothetical protein
MINITTSYAGWRMNINHLMHDFEQAAMINAGRAALKATHTGCCEFHFAKGNKDNMIKWGFTKEFRKPFYQLFCFLIIVDRKEVKYAVEYIQREAKKFLGGRSCASSLMDTWMTTLSLSGARRQ